MTPAEYNDRREGFYRRRRANLEDSAHLVTVLVNHFPMRGRGKTLKIEDILGPSAETQAEMKREMLKRRKMKRLASE